MFLTDHEIDSTTFDWAIEEVDNGCINSINTGQFALSADALEIIDPCEFPHAIRSQEPVYELKYGYDLLSKFLRPEFRKRILK